MQQVVLEHLRPQETARRSETHRTLALHLVLCHGGLGHYRLMTPIECGPYAIVKYGSMYVMMGRAPPRPDAGRVCAPGRGRDYRYPSVVPAF